MRFAVQIRTPRLPQPARGAESSQRDGSWYHPWYRLTGAASQECTLSGVLYRITHSTGGSSETPEVARSFLTLAPFFTWKAT